MQIKEIIKAFTNMILSDDDNCPTCETILAELETIDDETDEVGIQFVKTNDVEVAEDLGISHLPALVYYEGGVPSIYDGRCLAGKGSTGKQYMAYQYNNHLFCCFWLNFPCFFIISPELQ